MANHVVKPTYVDYIPPDTPRDIDGHPICRCGRLADKLHCPGCGSAAVYNLASLCDTVRDTAGVEMLVPVYRCRRCGGVFNKHTFRIACDAPQIITKSVAAKRAVDKATEAVAKIKGPNRMAELKELFEAQAKRAAENDPRLKL